MICCKKGNEQLQFLGKENSSKRLVLMNAEQKRKFQIFIIRLMEALQ